MSAARHNRLIALAAGGTGGHMFPAQALAEEMRRRGWRILLFTDERGLRYGDDIKPDILVTLKAANPNASGLMAKIRAGFSLLGSIWQARNEIKRHQPDIVVGFGGYPSAPSMLASRMSGIPYGVHEQNAVLGRVNRLVAANANFVAHAFPHLEKLPARVQGDIIQTGNPVRDAMARLSHSAYKPLTTDGPIQLLIFGGSQGARIISKTVTAAITQLDKDQILPRLRIVQQARQEDLDEVQQAYRDNSIKAEVAPFFTDLPQKLQQAHLAICRSGASSVTELALVGRPSILIPLAIAMDNHQMGNAKVLADREAAIIVTEQECSQEKMRDLLTELLCAPDRVNQMAAKAYGAVKENAVTRLADIVETHAAG
ncbi:MAG: undecaprenyldiphospho-muramoylpentapeptide beta-N-acetylglucosaminyltransferase [bacterium]